MCRGCKAFCRGGVRASAELLGGSHRMFCRPSMGFLVCVVAQIAGAAADRNGGALAESAREVCRACAVARSGTSKCNKPLL